jgi:hypothetical protein
MYFELLTLFLVAISAFFSFKAGYKAGVKVTIRDTATDAIAITLAALENKGVIERVIEDGVEIVKPGTKEYRTDEDD